MAINLIRAVAVLAVLLGGLFPLATASEFEVEFLIGDYLKTEGGDWDAKQSPLTKPFGIDFDSAGAMYLVELSSGRLIRQSVAGEVTVLRDRHERGFAGDGGPVGEAQFNGPHNCVVTSQDQLLVADTYNHAVRKVDLKTLQVKTIAGTGSGGFSGDRRKAVEAKFNYVMCIALDPKSEILHLADLKNRRIRKIDLATGWVETVAGNGKKGLPKDGAKATRAPLVDPRAVASDSKSNLYILERIGNALRVVRPNGTIHTIAGSGKRGHHDGPALQAQFASPKHLCCDPYGNVYIADDLNGAIRKYDPVTKEVSTILGRGHGDPRITLKNPHGVSWHNDTLHIVDTGNSRIMKLPAGKKP
ncbi:hypothetical protein N9Z02_00950 [Akkermansiaceae bacterium]|nr:hypothetical protein [Akkermansiaceae bacterium]